MCLIVELAITLLIGNLGDTRFRVREAAYAKLRRVSEEAAPLYLKHADHKDAELAGRCRKLFFLCGEQWAWGKASKVLPGRWQRQPWIHLGGSYYTDQTLPYRDAAGCNDSDGFNARSEAGWQEGWPRWRKATRLWVRDQLLQGRDQDSVRFDLALMADTEVVWTIDYLRRHEFHWQLYFADHQRWEIMAACNFWDALLYAPWLSPEGGRSCSQP